VNNFGEVALQLILLNSPPFKGGVRGGLCNLAFGSMLSAKQSLKSNRPKGDFIYEI